MLVGRSAIRINSTQPRSADTARYAVIEAGCVRIDKDAAGSGHNDRVTSGQRAVCRKFPTLGVGFCWDLGCPCCSSLCGRSDVKSANEDLASNQPDWVVRGKTVRQLVRDLLTFQDLDVPVRISLDGGESSKAISIVIATDGICLIMNCEIQEDDE
jgi:hypothetical protein